MSQHERGPIVSPWVGDAEMQERLEAFVLALGECIDTLQDLEVSRDYKQLEAETHRLGVDAVPLGYALLAEAAERVEQACACLGPDRTAPTKDAAHAVRAALVELTDVARRVRLGHRGGVF
ncbi:MAG TPA: hypothetical protein VMW35_22490 [Myxococcota bacterium]|jgi:HPt (histidine-containing phosphotransfer) domain-containing protein|nr:hypothetical protein [Myxococcota bacterium]